MKKIALSDPDNFSFAVFGDSRYSKFVFENLLKLVDHDIDIAFSVSLGNMVSKGKKEKYHFVLNQVKNNLGIPFMTVIGKRELKIGGRGLYQDIFGATCYAFHTGNAYFLALDNADKTGIKLMQEDNWLDKALQQSQAYDFRFVFMNIPLHDPRGGVCHDCLEKSTAEALERIFLKYHVSHIFAANIHGYFEGKWNGIPYTITGGGGAKLEGNDLNHYFFHFLKVNTHKGNFDVQVRKVPRPDRVWMDRSAYIGQQCLSFAKPHAISIISLFFLLALVTLISRSEGDRRKKTISD